MLSLTHELRPPAPNPPPPRPPAACPAPASCSSCCATAGRARAPSSPCHRARPFHDCGPCRDADVARAHLPRRRRGSTGGRPSSQFALNPSARVVLAADLGASHATLAATDLAGTVLGEPSGHRHRERPGGRARLDGVRAETCSTSRAPAPRPHRDRRRRSRARATLDGQPVNPPIMPGWDRFDVPGWVQQHLRCRSSSTTTSTSWPSASARSPGRTASTSCSSRWPPGSAPA